jgi:hypothetical protein
MRIYRFNWTVYRDRVMPAFARWLTANDARAVQALYQATRLAREETFVPAVMQCLRTWPRALAFVEHLPRGPHSLHEYRLLCSAEAFTALSDRYLYRHIPHLYRPSEALATIWSALVEQHCLYAETHEQVLSGETSSAALTEQSEKAGAGATGGSKSETYFEISERSAALRRPEGVFLGRHPNVLRLRGWLARTSVEALALFEFLACGRRSLPFDMETGGTLVQETRAGDTPDEADSAPLSYSGYLTPKEVTRLADCLQDLRAPSNVEAEHDYRSFRSQAGSQTPQRLIDEVLPAHGAAFLTVVHQAAALQQGLICSRG